MKVDIGIYHVKYVYLLIGPLRGCPLENIWYMLSLVFDGRKIFDASGYNIFSII